MRPRAREDVITQVELREATELLAGTSLAIGFIRELYLYALDRRLADGAKIEPGPLMFDSAIGVVCGRKQAATESRSRFVNVTAAQEGD